MTEVLLDSTVLIDLSRGKYAASEFIDNSRNLGVLLAVSVISAMELIIGCRNKSEVTKAEQLIADFSVLPMQPAISEKAYQWLLIYGKRHGLKIPDALIASTAVIHDMELAKDNVRDFNMLPGLRVMHPYE